MNYQEIPETLNGASFLAVMTDRVVCGKYKQGTGFTTCGGVLEDAEKKALEIRIFSREEEFRAFRSDLSRPWKYRHVRDAEGSGNFFDEVHYLDQDSRLTEKLDDEYTRFRTTGGGTYILSGSIQLRKVRVRTYLASEEGSHGILTPEDWRIVELTEDNEPGKEGI